MLRVQWWAKHWSLRLTAFQEMTEYAPVMLVFSDLLVLLVGCCGLPCQMQLTDLTGRIGSSFCYLKI